MLNFPFNHKKTLNLSSNHYMIDDKDCEQILLQVVNKRGLVHIQSGFTSSVSIIGFTLQTFSEMR